MKNAVLLVPGYIVTNSFLLKAVVRQVTKAHPPSISNTLDDRPHPPLTPANMFFVTRSVSVTLRSGLVLLFYSQLALYPSSLKTARSTSTEKRALHQSCATPLQVQDLPTLLITI